MADLPSILGGMAQGFIDFGKGAVDLFGTGGAAIGDLVDTIRTGKVSTKNQDDFRKWLYNTDSVEDAAAKGLGTALNGVQTVTDYIPGIGAVTKNPLFNAGQGALGGLADEFKMYGKDYDLARAGERAAVGAGGAMAASGLGDALKKSANPILSSGTVQGLARGATGGAIGAGGYTAIEGGDLNDIMNSAAQGAGMGAAIGGATGALQDFKPAKTYDLALTDDERQARIANAKNMLANEQNPERIAELNEQIKKYGGATAQPDYLGDEKYSKLVKKAKNYKTLDRFEKMNNPIKGSEIWGEKPKSYFERDSRAVRINMFPNDATKGTGLTKQYLLNMFKDAYDEGITDIVPSYGSYTKEGASFMNHLADQGWVKQNGRNGYNSYEIAPKIAEWQKTNPLADIYNVANSTTPKALENTLADADMAINSPKLTPEQEAYFKDSVIRDENGNLIPMYHGTPDGSFSVFNEGSYFTPNKEYADGYQWEGASVLRSNKKAANPKTFEVYIDSKKPFTLSDPKARDIYLNEYIKGGNSMYFDPYSDWTKAVKDLDEVDWTEGEELRAWLKENHPEYDALYLDEGGDGGYGEAEYKWRGKSLIPFEPNQIKDINNLRPTSDVDIMASRILPDEPDLGRALANQDLSVNNAKIAPGQLDLFDQPMPTKQVEEALALDGKYSPKDNKVTEAMRARAEEIMGGYKTSKKVPENELYNKIDESTLPSKRKSTGAILDDLYSKGVKPDEVSNKVIDQLVEKEIGDKMDKKNLATYLFGDMDDTTRKDFIKKNLYTTKDYDVDDLTEDILKNWARRKAIASGTLKKYNIDNLAIVGGNKTVRQGYTGALDSALSERLGIAPGNTYKQNGEFDTPGALGRYIGSESRPDFNNYMVKEVPDIEEALNTAGHERLHSFQAESRLDNRYSKEVADAYNGLASDLKKANAYKSDTEIQNRYKKGTEYWGDTDEQEARMLQQYLGARGFTDYNKRDARMYGKLEFDNDKIVPAFDKFFDKLRDLSKRGVALPALTALFGGGAYMASQNNDKEKEVK